MDLITNSPGLQHLAEYIFKNLNYIDLEKCAQVNDSWKNICENPYFLLSFCIHNGHLEANKIAWQQNILKVMKNADQKNLEKLITFLKRILNHNKYGKCAKQFCIFCCSVTTLDEHQSSWQQLDDPQDPFQCLFCGDCGQKFPQKLSLEEIPLRHFENSKEIPVHLEQVGATNGRPKYIKINGSLAAKVREKSM